MKPKTKRFWRDVLVSLTGNREVLRLTLRAEGAEAELVAVQEELNEALAKLDGVREIIHDDSNWGVGRGFVRDAIRKVINDAGTD